LCGITSGASDQARKVVSEGAVPIFVELLKYWNPQLLEHVRNIPLKDHRKKYCRFYGQLDI